MSDLADKIREQKAKKKIARVLYRLRDPEKYKAMRRKSLARNRKANRLCALRQAALYPEKKICRAILWREIRRNPSFRPSECSQCHKLCKPQAHHEDYSKPFEIIWLCSVCHTKLHRPDAIYSLDDLRAAAERQMKRGSGT